MHKLLKQANSIVTRVPDSRFWLYHLWIPLFFSIVILYLIEHSNIDIILANFFYQLQGDSWAMRKHWFFYDVMHHWGKQILILFGLVVLSLYAASYKFKTLSRWRWSLGFSIIAMILLPVLITKLKQFSGIPCPWSLELFGGSHPYLHTFQFSSQSDSGHCFPAGHASGGYALLSLYFACWPFVRKKVYLLLLPGLIVGLSFGLAQQVRGAHFFSHDLWTIALCWFGGLLLFKLAWIIKPPDANPQNLNRKTVKEDTE